HLYVAGAANLDSADRLSVRCNALREVDRGRLHAAASLLAGPKMSGRNRWREIPLAASTARTLSAGICFRARQFITTEGLEMPSAAAALVGPSRVSITSSTMFFSSSMSRVYHAA